MAEPEAPYFHYVAVSDHIYVISERTLGLLPRMLGGLLSPDSDKKLEKV